VAARKGFLFPVAVALGGLIAIQWQDIVRYMKIRQMSYGDGHPENVPARGRAAYPQHPSETDSSSPNYQTG
jgi:hypothetical protein